MTNPIQKIDLAAESPRFAAALEKERLLGLHLAKLDARIAAAQDGLRALSHSVDDRAEAMLAATDLDSVAAGGEAVLRDELAKLASDRQTTIRAQTMARSETGQAKGEVSVEVCRGLLPAYRARVDALAKALLACHAAHAAVDELTGELDRAGVQWTGQLRPVPIKFLRQIDRNDALPAWFLECRRYRLTDVEFPENWTRLWNKPPPAEPPPLHDDSSMILKFFRKR